MTAYRCYLLRVRNIRSEEEFIKLCGKLSSCDLICYAFDEGVYDSKTHEGFFDCYEDVKWNKHVQCMIGIAEQFPKMYFELEIREGEFGGFCKEYYHDMDIEVCYGEVVYEHPKKVQWTELAPF